MDKKNIVLSSKTVEISEYKNYIELLNRVCYYGAPNFNGVRLPYDETTEIKAQTLKNMPVVAKYIVDAQGNPSFGGHEVSRDENGEYVFGTTPIGVHTDVFIKEDTVVLPDKSTALLPCLFAKQRIWKRNNRAVAAIKRLFSEDNLHNSWEVAVLDFKYAEDGTKDLIDYTFEANCLLGTSKPAYGESAKILSISSESSELLVAEALAQDLLESSKNPTESEASDMEDKKTIDTSEQEVIAGGVELGEEEKAAETQPEETGTTEEQAEEKVISVGEIPAEKIENPLQAQLDEALAKIEELNASVAEKASALIEAQKQINEFTAQIAELAPYREAAEQAAREKAEAERKEKVDALRAYAEESGMVSKEELESGEIAEMIENLKETELKVLICDRIVAKQKTAKPAETAQKHNVKMKAEINFHEDTTNPVELFRKYING